MGAGRPFRGKRVLPRRRQADGTAGGGRQEGRRPGPRSDWVRRALLVLAPDASWKEELILGATHDGEL